MRCSSLATGSRCRFLRPSVRVFGLCTLFAFFAFAAEVEPPEVENQGTFHLVPGRPEVVAGEPLDLAVAVSGDFTLEQIAFSIQFDTARLEYIDVVVDPIVPVGPHTVFQSFHDAGSDWVQAVLELSPNDDEGSEIEFEIESEGSPEDTKTILTIHFQVRDDAPEGDAWVRFTLTATADYEGRLTDDGVAFFYNTVRIAGDGEVLGALFENVIEPTIPTPGISVAILGDVGLFNRGDANGDRLVDVTDPVYLLDFLYLGGGSPRSYRAADANLDGSVDLGDPLTLLFHLFVAPSW